MWNMWNMTMTTVAEASLVHCNCHSMFGIIGISTVIVHGQRQPQSVHRNTRTNEKKKKKKLKSPHLV
jgi:ribosomal protein S3